VSVEPELERSWARPRHRIRTPPLRAPPLRTPPLRTPTASRPLPRPPQLTRRPAFRGARAAPRWVSTRGRDWMSS